MVVQHLCSCTHSVMTDGQESVIYCTSHTYFINSVTVMLEACLDFTFFLLCHYTYNTFTSLAHSFIRLADS